MNREHFAAPVDPLALWVPLIAAGSIAGWVLVGWTVWTTVWGSA